MALRPHTTLTRTTVTLDGPWHFQPDGRDEGEAAGWMHGLPAPRPIAVPASWNDQYADLARYFGAGWYQTGFYARAEDLERVSQIRVGAAFYHCDAWLNGEFIGHFEGGYLPATFDTTGRLRRENRLVLRVDGRLTAQTVPSSADPPHDPRDMFGGQDQQFPAVRFDFFPYCGLNRPVQLVTLPQRHLTDLTVITQPAERGVRVSVRYTHNADSPLRLRLALCGQSVWLDAAATQGEVRFDIEAPDLWSPQAPTLHTLEAELWDADQLVDAARLSIGLRWVEVRDGQLLLNGQPIRLRGFGKHEDFPISGRGLAPAVNVRDFDLMRWCGANSFRTSHYPYSEEMLDLADQLGVLVIDETPAVGVWFGPGWEGRLDRCKALLAGLIERDKNRACVIAWSPVNEPMTDRPEALPFFVDLFAHGRRLDPTRPFIFVSWRGPLEDSYAVADICGYNRYAGWYIHQARLEQGFAQLRQDLQAIHDRFGKPILLSEFGADTLPGMHADPPEMFSEEYQAAMIEGYLDVSESLPFMIGEHVWNFADFRANQSITRVGGLNHKGVFTRDRRPKLAAHLLKRRWTHG